MSVSQNVIRSSDDLLAEPCLIFGTSHMAKRHQEGPLAWAESTTKCIYDVSRVVHCCSTLQTAFYAVSRVVHCCRTLRDAVI
jgi:hypothetical protein